MATDVFGVYDGQHLDFGPAIFERDQERRFRLAVEHFPALGDTRRRVDISARLASEGIDMVRNSRGVLGISLDSLQRASSRATSRHVPRRHP